MKQAFLIIFSFLTVTFLNAQITVDPAFPTADQSVVVTLNTTGTGLEGYTGDIYAHTGLTINGSDWQYVIGDWGNNSNQPQLTKIGTDLFELELTPTIRDFYNAGASDVITEMSFVFRSSDGSQQTSPDLFYEVYESAGLNISITVPVETPIIAKLNETIHVNWIANMADSSFLYIGDEKVFAGVGSSFEYEFPLTDYGKKWVKAVAINDTEMVADSFYYFVVPDPDFEVVPEGVQNGINIINESTVILCFYAPQKEFIIVGGDFSNWEIGPEWMMKLDEEADRFWIEITNLDPQTEYGFQYLVDGEFVVTDPYSEKILDPWSDPYIPEETYPNLKPYPYGKTDGLVSVFQIEEEEYEWQNTSFESPEKTDLVVYELLIRDFLAAQNYQTLKDTIGYLKSLGINAIELMPVNEFSGNLSWGYNPNHYLALDKYYGTKNAFKEFIDVCHEEGIAVILDVVFNHATRESPYVRLYYDHDLQQPTDDSPFYNPIPKHDYNVFSDMNHESLASQEYISRAIKYWLEEYKIDGYRLDLSKGFTQKNTLGDVNEWGQYDQSRINILKKYADSAWKVNPNAFFILEHFADNSEEKELSNNGMMLWGNSNYNYNEGTMGYTTGGKSDFSWISYKKRGWNEPNVVGYMESHDEERLMFKNITYGNSLGDYNTKDINTGLKRQELAAAFFFTIPGPKMIWQFGERGYDYTINYNPSDPDANDCRLCEKPPRWDYMENWNRRHLFYVYQALIDLKKNHDVFETENFELSVASAMKSIRLSSPEMSIVIIGNFDVVEGEINPKFYFTGTWYDYFGGTEIEVTDVNATIELQPGEYRIYASEKLTTPDFVGIDETINDRVSSLIVYPNPATNQLNLEMHLKQQSDIQIDIYDIQGRMVKNVFNGYLGGGLRNLNTDISNLQQGLYFVIVKANGQKTTKKLMIN